MRGIAKVAGVDAGIRARTPAERGYFLCVWSRSRGEENREPEAGERSRGIWPTSMLEVSLRTPTRNRVPTTHPSCLRR